MRVRDIPKAAKVYFKLAEFYAAGRTTSDRRLWLFHGPFEGNTKYLYLWITIHRPDIRAVWIANSDALAKRLNNHDAKAVRYPSLDGIRLVAGAGFHFVNDYGKKIPFRSSRSFLVSLWHGVGVKNIGVTREKNSGPLYIRSIFRPNFLVAASERHSKRFAASFLLPRKNCPILGTPRLDVAFDPELHQLATAIDADVTRSDVSLRLGKVTYLYAPTLRAGNRPFIDRAFPHPNQLNDTLAQRDAVLYVKLHPNTIRAKTDIQRLRELADCYPRIKVWPEGADFYTAIPDIDFLITDYSSIFADFLFSKSSGLILYPFDRAEYEGADRSFHFPYELIEGVRADDFDNLCRIIEAGNGNSVEDREASARTRRAFWDENRGIASPRIVAFFSSLSPTVLGGLAPLADRGPRSDKPL
ncbi:CDP-glycerol glycerophosphotransferase family protein [Aureimonas psammosilenae]|uniref:CDP-glycerol glycerophosphotransferase family protein n=1 Tax=Aureimonas psammosilenae TaxID=2495496 RepID=UPI001261037D|nr:CDP-glycerol glycerophosphotransferase family protein [Aureimonas psammosilenae]